MSDTHQGRRRCNKKGKKKKVATAIQCFVVSAIETMLNLPSSLGRPVSSCVCVSSASHSFFSSPCSIGKSPSVQQLNSVGEVFMRLKKCANATDQERRGEERRKREKKKLDA